MPMFPANTRQAGSRLRLHLTRPLRFLAARWTQSIHLRRLSATASERLLRDIGLTPADLEARIAGARGADLSDAAKETSGNW